MEPSPQPGSSRTYPGTQSPIRRRARSSVPESCQQFQETDPVARPDPCRSPPRDQPPTCALPRGSGFGSVRERSNSGNSTGRHFRRRLIAARRTGRRWMPDRGARDASASLFSLPPYKIAVCRRRHYRLICPAPHTVKPPDHNRETPLRTRPAPPAGGKVRRRAPQGHDPARIQILRLRHDPAFRARDHLRRGPERLR